MDLEMRNQNQKQQTKQDPLLGIDWGIKFCGFAFSPDGICVFPLEVVDQQPPESRRQGESPSGERVSPGGECALGHIEEKTKELINSKGIKKIIIGLPVSPNSQENQVCKDIRAFAEKLKQLVGLEIVFQNEKFSTKEGLKLKTKKEKRADHLAAAKILEYYLEK